VEKDLEPGVCNAAKKEGGIPSQICQGVGCSSFVEVLS
jgi:hypothetical protein